MPESTPNEKSFQTSVFSLDGKLALITGGGSGIGFHIAQCMVEAGAKVVLTGRREAVLQEAAQKLGSKATYFVHDITQLDTIPALVETIENQCGPIDILINNAGINMKKFAVEVTDADFDRVVQTNLHAVFSMTRECGKRMITRKEGSIIMITSMAALYGIDRVVAYTASKSAVAGMVKALTTEFSPYNVRINAVAPGFIETPMMLTAMNGDIPRRDKAMDRTPMGTWGKPDDVGWAAVFLASQAAKFITGVSLPVDGGNSIGF
jgi:NAD(P)-dependent dehydrogenase (short-subunit alcohol dehydrogenase family)